MRTRTFFAAALMFCAVAAAGAQATTTIPAGWDLFQTQPGTSFAGVPFQGVPLGSFDFGVPIGVQPTGTTDTIVQRLFPAIGDPPASAVVPIELVALHLQSAIPVDLGLGVSTYYVTLQKERGGPSSTGSMTINFSGGGTGTFDSFFDVFFDIRLGSLSGPIAISGDEIIASHGSAWDSGNPPLHLSGVNDGFNPHGLIVEQGVGTIPLAHVVGPPVGSGPPVPEPATSTLGVLGLLALGWTLCRRREPLAA